MPINKFYSIDYLLKNKTKVNSNFLLELNNYNNFVIFRKENKFSRKTLNKLFTFLNRNYQIKFVIILVLLIEPVVTTKRIISIKKVLSKSLGCFRIMNHIFSNLKLL